MSTFQEGEEIAIFGAIYNEKDFVLRWRNIRLRCRLLESWYIYIYPQFLKICPEFAVNARRNLILLFPL